MGLSDEKKGENLASEKDSSSLDKSEHKFPELNLSAGALGSGSSTSSKEGAPDLDLASVLDLNLDSLDAFEFEPLSKEDAKKAILPDLFSMSLSGLDKKAKAEPSEFAKVSSGADESSMKADVKAKEECKTDVHKKVDTKEASKLPESISPAENHKSKQDGVKEDEKKDNVKDAEQTASTADTTSESSKQDGDQAPDSEVNVVSVMSKTALLAVAKEEATRLDVNAFGSEENRGSESESSEHKEAESSSIESESADKDAEKGLGNYIEFAKTVDNEALTSADIEALSAQYDSIASSADNLENKKTTAAPAVQSSNVKFQTRPTIMNPAEKHDVSIEFGDDDAPDLSGVRVIPQDEFERTLVFEKNENRWEDAHKYELPQVGDTVGNYRIEAELGRGGFGAVYKVLNLNLGREEALKLILPSAKSQCDDVEKRFTREVNIVSRLEHPNIVRLYSSGMLDHGIIWMTMALVNGERLDERIEKNGCMQFGKARNLFLQLLSGLQEAHKRQIVHRDIKPANIILERKEGYADQVVILDFGLSKAIGANEDAALQNVTCIDSRRVYGSPQYMAPEQLNKGRLGPWTDVYSAGQVFFELITGKVAFDGDSVFELCYKQCYEPINFPEKLRGTAIEAVISRACSKNPVDRYKDAGEFFDAVCHINDLNDPASVLTQEMKISRNLSDVGTSGKSCLDEKKSETKVTLPPVEEVPTRHTERTGQLRRVTFFNALVFVFLGVCLVLFFVCAFAVAFGAIEINLKI